MRTTWILAGWMMAMAAGCGDGGAAGEPPPSSPAPREDLGRDILSTALEVDLATLRATATISLSGSQDTGASFEAQGLTIEAVRSAEGPLQYALSDGRLDIGVPATERSTEVVIEYGFTVQNSFEGLMADGSTLTWPYYCGNLFPCHSDPADGTKLALSVQGTPAGQTTIHAPRVDLDAPSYMLAWTTGDYVPLDLGTTPAGTHLTAYAFAGGEAAAEMGTATLREVFSWYETTYGPYPFGKEAGAVAVKWGVQYGGMEHHPFWHVSEFAMGDAWIQAHEVAHGWFGDGVRIACWEDLVLSEGTVSYLEARAVAQVMGDAEAQKIWSAYQARLDAAMAGTAPKIARPPGCGEADPYQSWGFDIPYMKGAFFFRALEGKIGLEELDGALARFVAQYRGQAAHFADLLAVVEAESGYDPTACAASWLEAEAVPAEPVCP